METPNERWLYSITLSSGGQQSQHIQLDILSGKLLVTKAAWNPSGCDYHGTNISAFIGRVCFFLASHVFFFFNICIFLRSYDVVPSDIVEWTKVPHPSMREPL